VDISKKRPRRGRGDLRRLWFPTLIGALCIAAYVALFIARLPTTATAPNAPQLWSTWIDGFAAKHQLDGLLSHTCPVTRVMVVDTQSGTITKCLRTARGYGCSGIRVAPDNRHVAVAERPDQMLWVSTLTGLVAARTTGGQFMGGGIEEQLIAGIDGPADDPWIYYAASVQQGCRSRLYKWRPRTGEQHVVIDEAAYAMPVGVNASKPWTNRYALIRRDGHVETVSAPSFEQAYSTNTYTITHRGPQPRDTAEGPVLRIIKASPAACSSPIYVTPDGARVFILVGSEGVQGYDLGTGEGLGTLQPSMFELPDRDQLAIAGDGRFMLVPVMHHSILVRNLETQAWLARLNYPQEFISPALVCSADSRWLAAAPFKSVGTAPSRPAYIHELFLYDLSPIIDQR
jgi:hypothetical protein